MKKKFSKKKRNKFKRKEELKKYLFAILEKAKCADCETKNIIVLEFDHREPKKKKHNISSIMRNVLSMKILKEELKKCDIVCANCHRVRTATQFGNWRLKRPA